MNARRRPTDFHLPSFTSEGVLPIGDYEFTLGELLQSPLVLGFDDCSPTWDIAWRRRLVMNLSVLVHHLWPLGITEIFIDGSFVEDKDHPNDIDGYFECGLQQLADGVLEESLNRLDPHKSWTWDPARRQSIPGISKKQLPMWCQYRVELFPHYGQPSGIRDQYGNLLDFPAAFRLSRTGIPKGIIKIVPES